MKLKNLTPEDESEAREFTEKQFKKTKPTKTMANEMNAKNFKKSYTADIKKLSGKTVNQKKIVESVTNSGTNITVVYGKPGTGKTYTAIQATLKEFHSGTYEKIYLSKSVKTLDNKSEDIGFLKGTLEEKIVPFLFSYDFNFKQIISPVSYQSARESQLIEFLPLAYIRGVGLSNCIVILDEAQNINSSILRTVLSRIGKNCKLIIMGDTQQKDSGGANQTNGLGFLIKHFSDIKGFDFIQMGKEDQCRNELINRIEDRYDKLEEDGHVII